MSRSLLLGRDGQVGWELARTLGPLGEVSALGRGDLDLTELDAIRQVVREAQPQIVVNAAAYTDVDGAEDEPELARRVNAEAPGVLAQEAERLGALLVHFSTDYVFDGEKGTPYTEEDEPNPINEYGRGKLAGERAVQQAGGAHFILRSSWVYSTRRECFVTKVLRWARSQDVLRIVDDRFGSPTWCRSLALATAEMLAIADERGPAWAREHSGLYHVVCGGSPSRFELAQAVLELDPHPSEQRTVRIEPASSDEFPTPARRPPSSALDPSRFESAFGLSLPPWREALGLALEESGPRR